MADLIALIASSPDELAIKIDLALCLLILRGRELGELEPRQVVGVDGKAREIRAPPRIWIDRLARAVEVGAFDRLEPKAIADRILMTEPAPA